MASQLPDNVTVVVARGQWMSVKITPWKFRDVGCRSEESLLASSPCIEEHGTKRKVQDLSELDVRYGRL